MDLTATIAKLRDELEVAAKEERALRVRVSNLRTAIDALTNLNTAGDVAPEPADEPVIIGVEDDDWSHLDRTVAVELMLREVGESDARALASRLAKRNRNDTPGAITNALLYLVQKDRAVKVRRGFYAPAPANAENPAATGFSVDVPASGRGGDSDAQAETPSDHGDDDRNNHRDHDQGAPVRRLFS